jgi:hypothetical protein
VGVSSWSVRLCGLHSDVASLADRGNAAEDEGVLRVGGTLAILDLYESAGLVDVLAGMVAIPVSFVLRLIKTGRLSEPRQVRQAWVEHGRNDTYPTLAEVRQVCGRVLPGAEVRKHLLWRYSIIWRKVA